MRRRRGRDSRRPDLLLERDAECAAILERLADARDGSGSVILIEGPAGQGKSRLLTLAGDAARERGFRVLGAYGAELEVRFPFGIAIQLFEPWWLGAPAGERAAVVGDPDGAVAQLLRRGPRPASADGGYATIHGLLRLTARLAQQPATGEGARRPLAMLVDDAHWADEPSLRFLAYLGERIADLPVVLAVTLRQGEPAADPHAIASLRSAGDTVLRPESLSPAAVMAMAQAALPAADEAFCTAARRLTGGNPLLLQALLDQVLRDELPANAATAARLERLAPEAVLDAVVARLGSMPEPLRRVAHAVAILGDGTPLRRVARLADLDAGEAAAAADGLADMQLLWPGDPLSYVHPLIRRAVEQSIAPLHRGQAHLRAAAILAQEGAPDEIVAPHLLVAPAAGDARTVAVLRAAAATAGASGDADTRVQMLRRALAEGAGDARADVLAELAEAEAAAALPEAVGRLRDAIAAVADPGRRAELSRHLGSVLYRAGRYAAAAEAALRGLEDVDDPGSGLARDLAAMRFAAESLAGARAGDAERQADRLAGGSGELRGSERAALAHLAMLRATQGTPRSAVRRLADRAWDGGRLLEGDIAPGASWPLLATALLTVDELERELEVCDAALARATERQSPAEVALVHHLRAWGRYERGEVDAAAAAAAAAVDALPQSGPSSFRTAYSAIACCHIQQGRLEEAEAALAIIDHPQLRTSDQLPPLLLARALLRSDQRRPAEALADAVQAGRLWEERFGGAAPGAIAWRSAAALAQLALGDESEARRLAAEELALAEAAGVTRLVMRNLRILGLVEGGEPGIQLLARAVAIGAEHPPRLEHVAALVALGGALRRINQRVAARDPLRHAIELGRRGGASALVDAALEELRATGARPRSAARWGPDALTPSERRVAELAADGLTTREIADTLFVTPKTVEFHLRHVYQKLGVNSRDRLSGALRERS